MEKILNFIIDNWVWFTLGGFTILVIGRTMIKNPAYSLKEIAKNPLLIFKLFSTAVDEAMDTVQDITEIIEDVSDIIEPIAGDSKIGKTIKTVSDASKEVEAASEIVEKTIDNLNKED